MCVVSMVFDHYDKVFPWPQPDLTTPLPLVPGGTITATPLSSFQIISQEEVESLKKLIKEFKEAVEAAKTVDRLTGQPDCEDPEKKKLEDRVTLLEQQIAKMSKPTKKPRKRTSRK